MKHSSIHSNKSKLWDTWILVLVGLPITSGLLLLTQPNFQAQLAAWSNRTFSSLEEPYRYPFYQSLRQGDRRLVGQLQQVIAFHQERIQQQPDSALEQASLASVYLRMARLSGEGSWYLLAEQTAQRSLALLPTDNTEAMAVLARVTEARHDFAAALRLAEQIPNPKEALPIQVTSNLAIGKLDQASQAADVLVDETLSLNAFTLQALVKTAQGKDQDALQSFRYGLEVEEAGELSNSARTRTLLGRFYYQRGELQRAGDLYREALQILPDDPQALLNQAQLALRTGDYRQAERNYARISGSQPTVFEPLILRGRARIKMLQSKRAEAETLWSAAETLLRQSFGNSTTSTFSFGHRRDLSRLLLERGHPQDIPEAVTLMEAEVKLRRDAETLNTYAWALMQAQRWQEAETVIGEAIGLGTKNPGLFDRAAAIAEGRGDAAAASRYRQQMQVIDPTFDEAARRVIDLGAGLGS